jgi:isopenicillin-N N-acyltransferase like protein
VAIEEEDWGEIARRTSPFLAAARSALPELMDELEGMAAGAGVTLDDLAVLNCFEEVWPEHLDACTSFVSGRYLMHAEMWYTGHDDIVVVVAEPEDGPVFVSPTCAGFLPAVGVSGSGFAHGVDSLTARDDRKGIPRVMVSRAALGAASLEVAIESTQIDGRAGGYAHVLATADRRVAVETSATMSAEIDNCSAHTNHYLSDTPVGAGDGPGTRARLERARWLLAHEAPTDLEDCIRLLSDHNSEPQAICAHADTARGNATVFGMACDLVTGEVIVSDGRPCEGRWHRIRVPGYEPAGANRVG